MSQDSTKPGVTIVYGDCFAEGWTGRRRRRLPWYARLWRWMVRR